jgi:hypothetical protein
VKLDVPGVANVVDTATQTGHAAPHVSWPPQPSEMVPHVVPAPAQVVGAPAPVHALHVPFVNSPSFVVAHAWVPMVHVPTPA